jgi:hydroxymethylpyrimidine/phosphomethylpyrimidine kinase
LHGTGCVLSSAIASQLALGRNIVDAVERAKAFTRRAIENGRELALGKGPGPLMPSP